MFIKKCLRHFPGRRSLSSSALSFYPPLRRSGFAVFTVTKPKGMDIVLQHPIPPFLTYVRHIGSRGASVEKDGLKKKVDLPYPEQKVRVYACEDLYEHWRKERKYRRTPRSGVFTEITYVDSMVNKGGKDKNMENAPTVLCIHGIPGNYGVFNHLITDLGNAGIRIVVPTFPDTLDLPGKHGVELFRHSVEEKTAVFKSFLKALNVTQLDAVVAHSSAIYPALRLALDPELKVKSQVFFNTGGHKKTVTMKPYWVVYVWAHMFLLPSLRKFALTSAKFMMKYVMRTPIKDDDVRGIILLATTMVFSEYWKTKEQFQEVARKQVPTLLCFSEDDKVVERDLTYEVISLLGASKENISFYDSEGKVKEKGNENSWLKLLSFEAGSHYVFRKHPKICNKEVLTLLERVNNHNTK